MNAKWFSLFITSISLRTILLSPLATAHLMMLIILFFSVRLLAVLRGHSLFSSPSQRPMTSDFEGFSIHFIIFPILILEKEPVFPFLMLSAKQGNYWYHFYNVFGMTQSSCTRSQHSTTRLSRRWY